MVAAGPIVSALDYRWLFWIPVAIVAAATLIAVRYVPESPNRAEGNVNWLGAGLLSAWLRGAAAAAQPGERVGLGLGAGARPVRRGRRPVRAVALRRGTLPHPA